MEPAIVLPNPTGHFSNLNFCLIVLSHFHQIEQQIWAILFLLCVEDDLKMNTIEKLLGACRRLVMHFKYSTIATAALVDRQKRMNMPVKNFYKMFYQVK